MKKKNIKPCDEEFVLLTLISSAVSGFTILPITISLSLTSLV